MIRAGAFVQVESSTDGVGKVLEVSGAEAEVEYFVSPAGPRVHRVRVPIQRLCEVELSPQTRIFSFDSERYSWRAGRVESGLIDAEAISSTEDHYHVRFPNGEDARVPISRLFLRWAHPIEDPTDYLADRVTDTPFFFDGRSHIVRYLSNQRAAFGGLTALASSAIELLPHQLAVARRVLADPIERYLLADEVGLGKTIEAGILIRQHVIDRPYDSRVLVVVPRHLVPQWKSELATKFFLSSPGPVTVVAEDNLGGAAPIEALSMLVIDEAHRAALNAFHGDPGERELYGRLRAMAARTPCLLLLSGTPVLHQEDGFLAMLHLLDPSGYRLEDRDSFRKRIRDRQTIAEAMADLVDDASPLFIGEAVERLEQLCPEDLRLMALCGQVRATLEGEVDGEARNSALRALRIHITETHRLHRRLLRTRRDDQRVRVHFSSRTGATVLKHEDHARAEAFDFLEAWRLGLSGGRSGNEPETHSWQALFAAWVECALSHPLKLVRHIEARLAAKSNPPTTPSTNNREILSCAWAFDDEEALLQARGRLIASCLDQDARALHLAAWMRTTPEIAKVIVFADDSQVADLLARTLRAELGDEEVARQEAAGAAVEAFHRRDGPSVLVCDASAEEGLNLQRIGAAIVHYDLPLEPARIEQRVGRVDRIEARGRMRNIVFTCGHPYESEWLEFLTDTARVFNRSVAPLQYVLLEATAAMRTRLCSDGPSAIADVSARLGNAKDGLEAEMRRIRAQEALESIEADPERDEEFFQNLLKADDVADEGGQHALDSWMVTRLQFLRRKEGESTRYVHDSRRPTLVPLQEAISRFSSCIDRTPNARRFRSELPLKPVTFERAVAEGSGRLGLVRVGHPFVEALEQLIRADDRGAAFAMWRYLPGFKASQQLYLRFDFVVETNLSQTCDLAESQRSSREALRRRADGAFPVTYRTVWLDSDLSEVRDDQLRAKLALPFSKGRRPDGGKDTNLRLDRWSKVDEVVPVGEWREFCARARRRAEELLREEDDFRERLRRHATQLRAAAKAVDGSLQSRLSRLAGAAREAEERTAQFERDVAEALALGIESPSVRVDSAGAIVLSCVDWAAE